ncbi:hypothetical protein TRIP_D50044 [uncultured Paludibacter sp.]|uniref:Uncharacterized protein n=1 Tax=uncultured Paludibacter sp. TaxID=497635 RepID=A0A653AKT3_9BACT|nr:hypothetical protein TRIP_D50044 [uncultured Paludibacter sp.]
MENKEISPYANYQFSDILNIYMESNNDFYSTTQRQKITN